MSGIVFFSSKNLKNMKKFYRDRLGVDLWKDQGRCIIFDNEGFKFAFCEVEEDPDTCGVITFIYDTREEVDEVYNDLEKIAESEPVSRRPEFDIYQFYAKDPEGRTLEFQCFLGSKKKQ